MMAHTSLSRLRRIHHHCAYQQQTVAVEHEVGPEVDGAPWTDAAVQRFIVEGYVTIESSSLSPEHHVDIVRRAKSLQPHQIAEIAQAPPDTVWDSAKLSGHAPDYSQYYVVSKDQLGQERMGNVVNYEHDNSIGGLGRELQDAVDTVFDTPEVRAALTAVLGRGYVMDSKPHVAQLSSTGDRPGQQWHKGGNAKRRHHLPNFMFGFYFPQDTDVEIGPTHGLTRSQYYINTMPVIPQDQTAAAVLEKPGEQEAVEYLGPGLMSDTAFGVLDGGGIKTPPAHFGRPLYMRCKAGSTLIMNYDMWHRGTINHATNGRQRHMYKQYFLRTEEPAGLEPSWDHSSCKWQPQLDSPVSAEHSLLPVWLSVWERMCGRAAQSSDARIELDADWSTVCEAEASTRDLLPRLGMHGPPWVASHEMSATSVGGTWFEVPELAESSEGFPADTAALRSAYVLGRTANAETVERLLQLLVTGARHTFKQQVRDDVNAVHCYNASYALQHVCTLRPRLVLDCNLVERLVELLEQSLPSSPTSSFETADVIIVNYCSYLLAYACAGLMNGLGTRIEIHRGHSSAVLDDELVVETMTPAISRLLDIVDLNSPNRPPHDLIVEASAFYATTGPAAAEALGIAAAAICTRVESTAASRSAASIRWNALADEIESMVFDSFTLANECARKLGLKGVSSDMGMGGALEKAGISEQGMDYSHVQMATGQLNSTSAPLASQAAGVEAKLPLELRFLKAGSSTRPQLTLSTAPALLREPLGMILVRLGRGADIWSRALGVELTWARPCLKNTQTAFFTSFSDQKTWTYRLN